MARRAARRQRDEVQAHEKVAQSGPMRGEMGRGAAQAIALGGRDGVQGVLDRGPLLDLHNGQHLAALRQQFDATHKAMFGHNAPEEVVEIVSYRVRGVGLVPAVEMPRFKPTGVSLSDALRETRRVRFGGQEIDCPVYQRERIDVGATVRGPAILDQFDCTTVLEPGQVARVDEYKNLIVGMEGT